MYLCIYICMHAHTVNFEAYLCVYVCVCEYVYVCVSARVYAYMQSGSSE